MNPMGHITAAVGAANSYWTGGPPGKATVPPAAGTQSQHEASKTITTVAKIGGTLPVNGPPSDKAAVQHPAAKHPQPYHRSSAQLQDQVELVDRSRLATNKPALAPGTMVSNSGPALAKSLVQGSSQQHQPIQIFLGSGGKSSRSRRRYSYSDDDSDDGAPAPPGSRPPSYVDPRDPAGTHMERHGPMLMSMHILFSGLVAVNFIANVIAGRTGRMHANPLATLGDFENSPLQDAVTVHGFCSKKLGGCFRFETLADSQPDRAVKALLASFGVIWVLDILAGIAAALFCLATIWKRKSPSSARRQLSLWTNIFAASFTFCAVTCHFCIQGTASSQYGMTPGVGRLIPDLLALAATLISAGYLQMEGFSTEASHDHGHGHSHGH